jgi:hypothetical protein
MIDIHTNTNSLKSGSKKSGWGKGKRLKANGSSCSHSDLNFNAIAGFAEISCKNRKAISVAQWKSLLKNV